MNRDDKKQEVERLQQDLAAAQNVFLMNFQKVPVAEDFELRKQVRAAGGQYRVVKNTLVRRGGKGTPTEPILESLEGPTAMALTDDNPVALAKALTTYAKANPNFTFRAGIVEGRVVSLQEFTELALLPSRDELLAKVMYLINAPARGIASTMQAVMRNIASVVDQAAKENKFKS